MDKSEAINVLKILKANCSKYFPEHQALDYAISSLKTDEAYQIMYEGEEIFTKVDMVAMLEQLDSEIQEQIAFMGDGEETNGMKRADNLVKDKINALKQSIWQDNYNVKKE